MLSFLNLTKVLGGDGISAIIVKNSKFICLLNKLFFKQVSNSS